MCDSRPSSGRGSLLEGRKAVWRMKLQTLKKKEKNAPFIYLVKKIKMQTVCTVCYICV